MSARVLVGSLCYRNPKQILAAAKTVAHQTLPARHVIIDDGSGDGSGERLAAVENPTFELTIGLTNLGICARVNQVMTLVRDEEFVCFMSDDHWTPDHLERAVALLDANGPHVGAAFGRVLVVDELGAVQGALDPAVILRELRAFDLAERFAPLSGDATIVSATDMQRALFYANVIPAPSIVFRASALRENLPYDETLPFEDFDMSLKLTRHYDWAYSTRSTVRYVQHGGNFTVTRRPLIMLGFAATLIRHAAEVPVADQDRVARLAARNLLAAGSSSWKKDRKLPTDFWKWIRAHRTAFGARLATIAFAAAATELGSGVLVRQIERLLD